MQRTGLDLRILVVAAMALGACARGGEGRVSPLPGGRQSPLLSPVTISPVAWPGSPTQRYPLTVDLEAAVLGPQDFPGLAPRYQIRSVFNDEVSSGIQVIYPTAEGRYHPFAEGFSTELRVFADPARVPAAYSEYLLRLPGPARPLPGPADAAHGVVIEEPGGGGRTVWGHYVVFAHGNLIGYIRIRIGHPLSDRDLQDKIAAILSRLGGRR